MEQGTPRSVAHDRVIDVLHGIKENIDDDPRVTVTDVASAVGLSTKTFYRWLQNPPDRIDVTQVAAAADWLSERFGHANFAALWVRAMKRYPSGGVKQ